MQIRNFEIADIDDILKLAEDWCETQNMELNHESFTNHILRIHEKGAILVADDNGVFIGGIAFIPATNPFTGEKILHQSDLFVRPEYRNQGIATILKKRANEYFMEKF